MKFEDLQIESISDLMTEDQFGWVNVSISFTEQELNAHPSINIRVPIKYDRGWTLDEVRAVAVERASRVLAAATDLFDGHNLTELQRLHDEFEAEQASVAGPLL